MQYRREKKGETHWIGSALRQGEVSLLPHMMVSRQSSYSMTSCPPADHCTICGLHFWWRDLKAISPKPTSKHNDSPQHRNISCNAKEFNVQIERLMFCKAIRHNATPFVCTLYYSTLRWAISHNAILFKRTLYHSTLRWAIWSNATPFVRTLCCSTLPWAIWRNATPFVYCNANER